MPEVLGYLGAGVLLGPYAHASSFVGDVGTVRAIATFAIVFRMFTLGLDFDARRLSGRWRAGLSAGVLEMGLCALAGIGLALVLGWPVLHGAILGAALGTTSTSILSKALADRNMSAREDARAAGAATLVEDLIAMGLLALLYIFSGEPGQVWENALGLVVFATLALTAGAILVPVVLDRLGRAHSDELTMVSVVAILFGFAALSELLGAGRPIGAFLAGIAVGAARHGPGVSARVLPLRDVLVAVAYVSIGLFLDPRVILEVAPLSVGIVLLFVPLKVAGTAIGLRLGGTPPLVAARAGAILGQAGTMGLVFACTPMLAPDVGARLMAMAFVAWAFTVALTPLRLRYLPDAAEALARALGARDRAAARVGRLSRQPGQAAKEAATAAVLAAGCAFAFPVLADLGARATLAFLPPLAAPVAIGAAGLVAGAFVLPFAIVAGASVGRLSREGIHRAALAPERLGAGRRDDARVWSRLATVGAVLFTLLAAAALGAALALPPARVPLLVGAAVAAVALLARQAWLLRLVDACERLVGARPRERDHRLTDFRGVGPFGFDVEALVLPAGARGAWASLADLRLQKETGAQVVAVVRPGRAVPEPVTPATQLRPGDEVVVGGTPAQVVAAKRYLLEPAGGVS